MIALADSSWVVALVNRRDPDHAAAARVAENLAAAPWLPTPALTEICYVLRARIGAAAVPALLGNLASGNPGLVLVEPEAEDLRRTTELLIGYADSGLDFVDALVVAQAERFNARTILTLDGRHFGVVRPRHCEAFELLPGRGG